jgi:hypothetical protein
MIFVILLFLFYFWEIYNKKYQIITIADRKMIDNILKYQNETGIYFKNSTNFKYGNLNILFNSFMINTHYEGNKYCNGKCIPGMDIPLYFSDNRHNICGYITFHPPYITLGKTSYRIQYIGNLASFTAKRDTNVITPITFKIDLKNSFITFEEYYKRIAANNTVFKPMISTYNTSFRHINYKPVVLPKSLAYAIDNFPSLIYFIGGDNQCAFINNLGGLKCMNITYCNYFTTLLLSPFINVVDLECCIKSVVVYEILDLFLHNSKSCLVITNCDVDTFNKYPKLKKYASHPVIYL